MNKPTDVFSVYFGTYFCVLWHFKGIHFAVMNYEFGVTLKDQAYVHHSYVTVKVVLIQHNPHNPMGLGSKPYLCGLSGVHGKPPAPEPR